MKNSWWWVLLWKCHDKGLPNQLKSSSYALALGDQLQPQPSRFHQSRRQPWHWLHQWSGRKRWTRRFLQWVATTQEGMLDDFFALFSGVLGLLPSISGVIFVFLKDVCNVLIHLTWSHAVDWTVYRFSWSFFRGKRSKGMMLHLHTLG